MSAAAAALLALLTAAPGGDGAALLLAAASVAPAAQDALALPGAPGALVSAAGTGELLRQVRAGVKADVLWSADEASVEQLKADGRVREARALLANRLVLVVPAGAKGTGDFRQVLAGAKRLGLADPAAVPAGRYARGWLERAGLWASVAERVVPLLDARATLAAVAAGRVDAAVVYATDARREAGVRVVYEVPASSAPRVLYVLARLSDRAEAKALYGWLSGEAARARYAAAGFEVLP